ncbi:hypothetical protein [Peterkaempfera bronchialis]|uniref:hypothetical protein n=1 Tax=Peterkaempfera bronchialis TaxID=2126346 RepID=UPI00158887AC|nr:hypothetical protein [Peterkaempfera bronchialis]
MRDFVTRRTTVHLGMPDSVASSRASTPSSGTRMRSSSPEHYNEGMTVFLCSEGLNRACPCGAPVATLAADCFGPYEPHLDPVRTYAFASTQLLHDYFPP